MLAGFILSKKHTFYKNQKNVTEAKDNLFPGLFYATDYSCLLRLKYQKNAKKKFIYLFILDIC